tara:strand:+ start:186 stop:368 length:183 start_codon:yes stop_codon:yes gene_type:complete
MKKKQKDKLNYELRGLLYEWKKERPFEFKLYEQNNLPMPELMVELLTWLLTSNRVKGINI